MFALSPVPGVLPQRQLVVTAMPYRGQTALRTDAQVAWLPARPAAERIPSGVRAVTVTPVFGLNQDPAATGSTTRSRSPIRPRWPGSWRWPMP